MSNRIRAFWTWFVDWHSDVAAAYDSGDAQWLATELTARIKSIERRLNWEMGPYHPPDQTLVISPSVRDNIALAGRVVAAAPAVDGWRFLPAKPPKAMKRLIMELPAEVVGDAWSYQLTAFNKMEFFDIDVYTDVAADSPLTPRNLEMAVHRLIEAIVGEMTYLDRIAAVRVHRAGAEQPGNLTPLARLGRHIASLHGA